ncbi:unknown [Prevotella sp. CAG:1185]|nr:unknown [Prevotella sp. CAG:1185]
MNDIQRETIPNTILTRNVRNHNQMNIIIMKFIFHLSASILSYHITIRFFLKGLIDIYPFIY